MEIAGGLGCEVGERWPSHQGAAQHWPVKDIYCSIMATPQKMLTSSNILHHLAYYFLTLALIT